MGGDVNQSDFDLEVDQRIAALRSNPDSFLQRFDTNQDGRIDGQEMAAVRAVITHEILSGTQATNNPLVVRDRFEFLSELGHGAQGVTHLARDLKTGDLVAVKVMNLKTAKEWKAIDLFHREVEALRRLSHPQIPAFIDAFDIDETEFYLVQAFVPGDNLMVRLARQELMDEVRLRDIAEQLLEVLAYLHRQSPPVLHRDVKPANIIIGNDGKVSLVDFGAVQNQGSRGTTIVGTSGYMPPEQLSGHAVPASDVYAAGALLVHAATRTHPADLDVSRLKLQWRSRARLAETLQDWIDRLISPVVEDRPRNAAEALRWLKVGESTEVSTSSLRPRPVRALAKSLVSPKGSISITQGDNGFMMVIQPASWTVFLFKIGLVGVPILALIFVAPTTAQRFMFAAAGIIIGAFYLWKFLRYRALRTLKVSADRVELLSDGILEASMGVGELDGPAVYFRRPHTGFLLKKKDGQTIQLTHALPGKDEDWASHEIRKYLAELKS